jgi:hypothetical protein
MNINELRTKMNDFLDQLEKEENEEKKVYNVKSFHDSTKEEIKEYLGLHRSNKINISDYWNVGDKRVEDNGATYVIVDIRDKITIMRTDLIELKLGMCRTDVNNFKYLGSVVDKYLEKLSSSILGDTFSDLSIYKLFDYCRLRQLWLPSASEVFGDNDLGLIKKDGEQFEYFKKRENRQLDSWWWTRSGCPYSSGCVNFVICDLDGSQYSEFTYRSAGLTPCFYI